MKIYNSIDENKLELLCGEIDAIVEYSNKIYTKYKCNKSTIMNDLEGCLNYDLKHLTMGGNEIDDILVDAVVTARNIEEYFFIIYNQMDRDLYIAKNAYRARK